jgi:hypothetical protein
LATLTGLPLDAPNTGAELWGSQVNFTRPERSPCLAGLADNDPRRDEALAIIRKGSDSLLARPREDMPRAEESDMARRGLPSKPAQSQTGTVRSSYRVPHR